MINAALLAMTRHDCIRMRQCCHMPVPQPPVADPRRLANHFAGLHMHSSGRAPENHGGLGSSASAGSSLSACARLKPETLPNLLGNLRGFLMKRPGRRSRLGLTCKQSEESPESCCFRNDPWPLRRTGVEGCASDGKSVVKPMPVFTSAHSASRAEPDRVLIDKSLCDSPNLVAFGVQTLDLEAGQPGEKT